MNLPAYQSRPLREVQPVLSFGEQIDPIAALRNCEPGKCFVVDTKEARQRIWGFAIRLEIPIQTRRDGERFLICRELEEKK